MFWAGWVKGIILGTWLLLALFYQSTPSCLKVGGGVGGVVVAYVIIVSAQSKELGFWVF